MKSFTFREYLEWSYKILPILIVVLVFYDMQTLNQFGYEQGYFLYILLDSSLVNFAYILTNSLIIIFYLSFILFIAYIFNLVQNYILCMFKRSQYYKEVYIVCFYIVIGYLYILLFKNSNFNTYIFFSDPIKFLQQNGLKIILLHFLFILWFRELISFIFKFKNKYKKLKKINKRNLQLLILFLFILITFCSYVYNEKYIYFNITILLYIHSLIIYFQFITNLNSYNKRLSRKTPFVLINTSMLVLLLVIFSINVKLWKDYIVVKNHNEPTSVNLLFNRANLLEGNLDRNVTIPKVIISNFRTKYYEYYHKEEDIIKQVNLSHNIKYLPLGNKLSMYFKNDYKTKRIITFLVEEKKFSNDVNSSFSIIQMTSYDTNTSRLF